MRTIPGYSLQTAHAKGRGRLQGIPDRKGSDLVAAYLLIQQSARIAAELAAVEARRALLEATLTALGQKLGTLDVGAATRQRQVALVPKQAKRPSEGASAPDAGVPGRQIFRMGY